MIRPLFFTVPLLFTGVVPALAQTHAARPPARPQAAQPHAPPRNHGGAHVRPAAAHHAAVHARLPGTWRGSLRPAHGAPRDMHLSVVSDTVQGVTLTVNTDPTVRAGRATDVALDDSRLRWTLEVAGAACTATAVVVAATAAAPETLEGSVACPSGTMNFSLRRATS